MKESEGCNGTEQFCEVPLSAGSFYFYPRVIKKVQLCGVLGLIAIRLAAYSLGGSWN